MFFWPIPLMVTGFTVILMSMAIAPLLKNPFVFFPLR